MGTRAPVLEGRVNPPDRGLIHNGTEVAGRGGVGTQAERRAKARADRDRPFLGIDNDHRISEVTVSPGPGYKGRQSRQLCQSLYKKVFRKSGCNSGSSTTDRKISAESPDRDDRKSAAPRGQWT